jgi:hypothetical protein
MGDKPWALVCRAVEITSPFDSPPCQTILVGVAEGRAFCIPELKQPDFPSTKSSSDLEGKTRCRSFALVPSD